VYWLMQNYDAKEFLNIGTGVDHSIAELALAIAKTVGYTGKLVQDTTKPDGMPKKLLDVSKMSQQGWHYSIDLQEGLEKTYAFFKQKH